MKRICLVYEYDYNDVDILLVPNFIAENIDSYVQQFFNWVALPEHKEQFTKDNVVAIGTNEFIWWLEHFVLSDGQYVTLLESHTQFVPEYPMADF